MPIDEYDRTHSSEYPEIINVYHFDKISDVISSFFLNKKFNNDLILKSYNISQKDENIKLVENLNTDIKTLRESLKVLDYRKITNIGSRIYHIVLSQKEDGDITYQELFYLIQVWR